MIPPGSVTPPIVWMSQPLLMASPDAPDGSEMPAPMFRKCPSWAVAVRGDSDPAMVRQTPASTIFRMCGCIIGFLGVAV